MPATLAVMPRYIQEPLEWLAVAIIIVIAAIFTILTYLGVRD